LAEIIHDGSEKNFKNVPDISQDGEATRLRRGGVQIFNDDLIKIGR